MSHLKTLRRSRPSHLEDSFSELYHREFDAIYRFCLLRTSDRELARDFTQDTFTRFWQSMTQEKDIKNARTFLFTIARNAIIDWYRKKRSISLEKMMEADSEERKVPFQPVACESVETTVDAAFLKRKIEELLEPYALAVYMRCVEELKPREISKILGESANVISVRVSRGLEQLRRALHVETRRPSRA